jgi:SlyX protein
MNEERLVNIETKISLQEDLLDELNKMVYQQQKKLDQLDEVCRMLARHIESLAESGAGTGADGMPANERPPHY